MSYRLTNKEINLSNLDVIRVSYCDLQYLLRFFDKIGYTCGVYGWNADVYQFGSFAIVTGYRPTGNVRPSYDLIRRYNDAARDLGWSADDREKAAVLVDDFIKAAICENRNRI